MASRKLARRVSRIGVIAASAGVIAGLASFALRGFLLWHMILMLYTGFIMFPHYVAIAYISSSASKKGVLLTNAMAIASTPLVILPIIARVYWPRLASALVLVAAIAGIAASLGSAVERRGSLRLSLILAGIAYAGLALSTAYWWASGFRASLVDYALSVALAYTATLIYAVTSHSLPSTFADRPSPPVSLVAALGSVLAGLYVLEGNDPWIAGDIWLASALLYIYGARLHRVGRYFRVAREKSRGSEKAYRGLWYYLVGHVFVLLVVLLASVVLAWASREPVIPRARASLILLHLLGLGFAWMHVAIHAPMMLPVILGVRHAMRYNAWPYILVLGATLLWPVSGAASLVLAAAGFAAMLLVFFKV